MLLRPRHVSSAFRFNVPQHRTLLSSAFAALTQSPKPLSLHARRTLPYSKTVLFDIISDIESYPQFLPFILNAEVIARVSNASKDETFTQLPAVAGLQIGFQGISESFLSHVYCHSAQGIVEAIAGEEKACTALNAEELEGQGYGPIPAKELARAWEDKGPQIFKVCRTLWKLNDAALGGTDVDLRIHVEWKSALYAAVSQAASEKVAGIMVEAFEARAKQLAR